MPGSSVARRGGGWLVAWKYIGRPYLPGPDVMKARLHLRAVARTADGSIFEILPG